MSSTLASRPAVRTPRFAPPAPPTRKSVPRRRTLVEGAALVGRADRPVLRIVTVAEGAPPVTRVASTLVEPPTLVEPVACPEEARDEPSRRETKSLGPTRRVDVTEFFAPEYDGDEQAVQLAARRPSSLRLTRRGRLVVFAVSLAAALGVGFVAATGSLASNQPEPTRVVTVQPGQTLWDLATQADSATGGSDVRAMMTHLEQINHLDSSTLQVGQRLRVPR